MKSFKKWIEKKRWELKLKNMDFIWALYGGYSWQLFPPLLLQTFTRRNSARGGSRIPGAGCYDLEIRETCCGIQKQKKTSTNKLMTIFRLAFTLHVTCVHYIFFVCATGTLPRSFRCICQRFLDVLRRNEQGTKPKHPSSLVPILI